MKIITSEIAKLFKKYKFQILLALGMRVGLSHWLALVWVVLDKYIPTSESVLWETYYNLERSTSLLGRAFIDLWLRWDAVHYMNIAELGYKGVGVGDTVFFPLYPYLVGIISKLSSINVTLVGLLTSSIATMIALIFLYELVIELFNNEDLAKWSIICLAFYPTAFFLHAPYTDALFLSLSIGSILMMVKKKPLLAGWFVFFAGLTRAQGILLIIPMAIYIFQEHWKEKTFPNWGEILGLVISPLGFGVYSYWRLHSGISGFFSTYQTYSSSGFRFPFMNIFYAFKNLVQSPTLLEFSELFSTFMFLLIIVWMFTQNDFRKHLPILIYSSVIWLLISSKTVFYASHLQSTNRYVLHIFFAYVGLASMILSLSSQNQKRILLFLLILIIILSGLYSLWIFIG